MAEGAHGVNAAVERRVVAYLATMSERCCRCARRVVPNCRLCASGWANEILADYRRSAPAADRSLAKRMAMVVAALSRAGRPLSSAEIDLGGTCSPQLKRWTLMRMARHGVVERRPVRVHGGRTAYLYRLLSATARTERKNEDEED